MKFTDLPHSLQEYVRGNGVLPKKQNFSDEQWLLARQLRRSYFRGLQLVEPGTQYNQADYESLMRSEISTYARRVLTAPILEDWDEAIESCNRLRWLYEDMQSREAVRLSTLTPQKRRHVERELRRNCLRLALLDGRSLGEIEVFVTGKVYYGIPSWKNFDPRTDS